MHLEGRFFCTTDAILCVNHNAQVLILLSYKHFANVQRTYTIEFIKIRFKLTQPILRTSTG